MQPENQLGKSSAELGKTQTASVSIRMTQYCEKGFRKTVKRNKTLGKEVEEILLSLQKYPELGVGLSGDLSGFRCVHSYDNQFRVIYQYDKLGKEITVHAIGHRSSVYEELTRYLKMKTHQEFGGNEIPPSRTVTIA